MMISRLNKSCKYFPCHKELGDCTFCYCPFYPCGNQQRGSYLISGKRKVWSCQGCSWIHQKKIVDRIFQKIRRDNFGPLRQWSLRKAKGPAIIILGHGSQLKKANDTVRKVAKEIKKRVNLSFVEPAYLQLCQPHLKEVIEKTVQAGCRRVIIVPFFLFAGNHVGRDIPRAIKQEERKYKRVEFIYAKSIGADSRINDIVMERIREVAV